MFLILLRRKKIGIFISHNEDRKKYADKIIQIV